MNPIPKIEKEILKVYDMWLHSYLHGDVETYDKFLDDDYHFIGSTSNEEFLNRTNTTNFFAETAEQLAGKSQLRNETKIVEQFGELVFITHLFDAWFFTGEEWSFYERFRFTNALRKNKEGWRFIYQHYSTPDSKAQEGQTIGFDQITAENLQLREAIKRHTKELEEKNRELHIEGALERVRARAMAMHKSEELGEAAELLYEELGKLGLSNFINCGYVEIDEENNCQYGWMTNTEGKSMEKFNLPLVGDPILQLRYDAWLRKESVFCQTVDGDELKKHMQFANPQLDSEEVLEHVLNNFTNPTIFYNVNFSHGYLHYITSDYLTPHEESLLARFPGVFEMTYKRFLDLQKAEKQAREVQIELALEKVRSRTMAMQRSDELRDTAMLLFQQVEVLGINSFACGFNIWDEDKKAATAWMASKYGLQPPFKTNSAEDVYLLFLEAEKRGESLFVLEQQGTELEDHYKYLKTIPEVKNLSEAGVSFPTYQIIHCAYFSKGYLMFITLEPVPEAHTIFKRFASVFEQTYTRFLDLEKAEAQAREAQIEVALERVRAKAMAMRSSNELMEVANTLREQMRLLDQPGLESSMVLLYDEEKFTEEDWFAFLPPKGSNKKILTGTITWRLDENEVVKKLFELYKSGVSESTFNVKGEDLEELFEDIKEKFPVYIEYFDGELPENVIHFVTRFSGGHLLVTSQEEPNEQSKDLQRRVTNAFDLAYQRFLDLKKAEAQAREAQIEVSLERVRSRTMAMHKSEELAEVAALLFDQLKILGAQLWTAGFAICKKDENLVEKWMSSPIPGQMFNHLFVPYNADHGEQRMYNTWKNQEALHSYAQGGKELKDIYDHLMEIPSFKANFQKVIDYGRPLPVWQKNHIASYKYGYLLIITEEEFEEEYIFPRFAKVFEQTYTRFLDLEKAEAQAKEAQIEAALERVRSRTMAMQNSTELAETSIDMFKQMQTLGMRPWACGFNIFEKDERAVTQWMTAGNGGLSTPFMTPLTEDPFFIRISEARQRGEELFVMESGGQELEETYKYMFNLPGSKKALGDILASGFEMPKFQISHCAFFSQGYLMFITYEPYPEAYDVFKRFAKVFEQTYTRFLDLQKAEEQAREAQIEAALERVRSRAMAMRHSDDLIDCTRVIFDELEKLNLSIERSGIGIFDAKTKDCELWTTVINKDGEKELARGITSLTVHPLFISTFDSWLTQTPYSYTLEGQELQDYYNLVSKSKFVLSDDIVEKSTSLPKEYYHYSPFSGGGVYFFSDTEPKDEDRQIIRRLAEVFDLTYTRFLDLQKAEAQARESQIQLGLERVRAKAMAMRTPDDLKEVAIEIWRQIEGLGQEDLEVSVVHLYEKDSPNFKSLAAIPGPSGEIITMQSLFPVEAMEETRQMMENYWAGKKEYTIMLSPKKALQWQKIVLMNNPDLGMRRDEIIKDLKQPAQPEYWNFADYSGGSLLLVTHAPPTTETKSLLRRASSVFDLAYRRYLDLVNAENQAREAQIQLGLERVRARAMAMHKSEELAEAAELLYLQLKDLGIVPWTCGYVFVEEEKNEAKVWMVQPDGKFFWGLWTVPLYEDKVLKARHQSWRKGEKIHRKLLKGQENLDHHRYIVRHSPLGKGEAKEFLSALPDEILFTSVHFSHGYLEIITKNILNKEEESVLLRFAQVFELTYTRFLDLQKAEGQTREGQIQLGLERVRAKSMAMHQSEELLGTAEVFSKELIDLGIPHFMSGFVLINESEKKQEVWMGVPESDQRLNFYLPLKGDSILKERYESWKKAEPLFYQIAEGKALTGHLAVVAKHFENEEAQGLAEAMPNTIIFYCGNFKEGYLHILSQVRLDKEQELILTRFTKAFQQTYTRFLDLKKAEAQAREAQIEAALEKLRARSMAMQTSDELAEAARTLYKELYKLGITNLVTCGFVEIVENSAFQQGWVTLPDGDIAEGFKLPLKGDPILNKRFKAWKKQDKLFYQSVGGMELRKHLAYVNPTLESKQIETMVRENFPDPTLFYCWNFGHGYLHIITDQIFEEKETQIISRFARVFEQTYTRFLDLKKAEAQARKAQVEAAMERIRSRAIAMRSSDELLEVALEIRIQTDFLGQQDLEASVVHLYKKDAPFFESMTAIRTAGDEGRITTHRLQFPVDATPEIAQMMENYWAGLSQYTIELNHKQRERWGEVLEKYAPEVFTQRSQFDADDLAADRKEYWNFADFSGGSLLAVTYAPPSPDTNELFRRSADVFDLAYKRYKDLKKAEAQAREAQIEAALERIRSRSMAMHNTNELSEVILVLFQQFDLLDIVIDTCYIDIFDKDNQSFNLFIGTGTAIYPEQVTIPYSNHPLHQLNKRVREDNLEFFTFDEDKKSKDMYFEHFYPNAKGIKVPEERKALIAKGLGMTGSMALGEQSGMAMFNYRKIIYSEEENDILRRVNKVFQQTYIRFLDLQKAEAQARESQIQLALERVRARTMAMHKSEELIELNTIILQQVRNLGVEIFASGIHIADPNKPISETWIGDPVDGQMPRSVIDHSIDQLLVKMYQGWKSGEKFRIELMEGDDLKNHFQNMSLMIPEQKIFEVLLPPDKLHFHLAYFQYGFFVFITMNPCPENYDIFKRFAKVFEQTYTRFLDLQKAEAREREAVKQASLDRVRGEIASMRNATDLQRITPLVWSELQSLGVPFFRCGVMLVNEDTNILDFYLSNPEGKALAALHLDYESSELASDAITYWRKKEIYIEHWDQNQFIAFMKELMSQGQIVDAATYQGGEQAPTSLTLQFVPFTQGMVYVGSELALSEEALELVEELGKSLSVAYARYEDFTKLDLAKARAEKALLDLKAVQEQLIQQEKLASLGQLTAGIAHEIKNPLNFVNNFSDLSRELIEEVFEELAHITASEAKEEIIELLNDVRSNLTKVHEHGTRADGIVTSMLQHSRASSSKREPKPFNPLVKEFVNLSFHGMRAGKSPINVKIDLQLDSKVGDVTLISEDFSRVILNLSNNAFDAMRDKLNDPNKSSDYLPELRVKTSIEKDMVILSIGDNGPGISKNIQDKILQPFFTTKKGTEGTGLGLSITNDIIKAHGGELSLESELGKGTRFTVNLPVNS